MLRRRGESDSLSRNVRYNKRAFRVSFESEIMMEIIIIEALFRSPPDGSRTFIPNPNFFSLFFSLFRSCWHTDALVFFSLHTYFRFEHPLFLSPFFSIFFPFVIFNNNDKSYKRRFEIRESSRPFCRSFISNRFCGDRANCRRSPLLLYERNRKLVEFRFLRPSGQKHNFKGGFVRNV